MKIRSEEKIQREEMKEEFDYKKAVEELEANAAKGEDPSTGIGDIDNYMKRSHSLSKPAAPIFVEPARLWRRRKSSPGASAKAASAEEADRRSRQRKQAEETGSGKVKC